MASMTPQPLVAVLDVERSNRWYQQALGVESSHGGMDYEQLTSNGFLILQLHRLGESHHHEPIGTIELPRGNGVALWFYTDDFDAAVSRIRGAGPLVVTDVHRNPNAGHREMWIRDPDGYLVVVAGT